MYPPFSGDWAKNYQLRMLCKFRKQLKRAVIQWDAHKKVGTPVITLFII
jgi:hypothetical protein